jgi:DNA-binding SARP family transcriptional activator
MGQPWRIELFGGLRVQREEQVITRFRTQKTALLLAYLACHYRRMHPREALIELLWPECVPEVGRHKLSVALSSLRSQLEPGGSSGLTVLMADRISLGLNLQAVQIDAAEFDSALASAAPAASSAECSPVPALARAVDLYRGPLLAGYYEDWVEREQRHREECFFQAIGQLIACLTQAGDLERALQYALRAVSIDPLREPAHQEAMRLYSTLGQPAAAVRQYRDLEQILKQELGTSPGRATRQLAEEISRGDASALNLPAIDRPASSIPSPPRPLAPSPPRVRFATLRSAEWLESVGGAVPLDSPFYIERSIDREFHTAIQQRESLVLVKGARETGKTSLLARGLQQARQMGAKVVLTDFRSFNAMHRQSAEALLLALGEMIGEQLDLDIMPGDVWQSGRGPNPNFGRYLRREVLGSLSAPLVWGLDEVDRLFDCAFGGEIFGMFRSWHNERALAPSGPWSRLTLVIAYATEAHLFIKDPNQSPFNVGTRLSLADFSPEQVAELNARYASPLRDRKALERYYHLVGGHPYLVRRGLHEMTTAATDLGVLEENAASEEGIFGDHLRRLLALLHRDPPLAEAMREVLRKRSCPTLESFYRLRSAGLVTGRSERDVQPRCCLYDTYLTRRLS